MNKFTKAFLALTLIASIQIAATAQSLQGYSISDNNTDDPPFNEQQLYRFNVTTGAGTLITGLGGQGQEDGVGGLKREYEGMASIDGVLYGVSQHLAGRACNQNNDPLLGLNSDVRIFRSGPLQPVVGGLPGPTPTPLPNGVASAIGPQIGETCGDFGEETGAAYDPIGGFIYALFADDASSPAAVRARLFRISPTTGLGTPVSTNGGVTGGIVEADVSQPGDDFPTLDGLAILPNGVAYATDLRFTNNPTQDTNNTTGAFDNGGLYRISLTNARATFVKYLFRTDLNRDSGAANIGLTIYILAENGQIYNTTADPLSTINGPIALNLPGCLGQGTFCGELEGFDIPQPGTR